MRTRVSYPIEIKMKAIEMKLKGISTKTIMDELNIRNDSQVETWVRWHRNGELHRLEQPVGKQYTYGKGPEFSSEIEQLTAENRFLKHQLEMLKKFKM